MKIEDMQTHKKKLSFLNCIRSEDVAEAIEAGMTREEHPAQRMKSWRFRLWYRWYGLLFKIKMMLGRDVK